MPQPKRIELQRHAEALAGRESEVRLVWISAIEAVQRSGKSP
jgi:hypothetical protein